MRTANGTSTIVLAMFLVLLSSTSTSAGSIDDQIASLYKELRKVEVDLERSLRLTGLSADPWQKPDQQTIRLRDARSLLARLNEIDFQASRIESKRTNKVQDLERRINVLRSATWDWEQQQEMPAASDTQISSLEGRISGIVIDSVSGNPIPNVDMYLFDSAGSFKGYARTSDQGTYSIGGLIEGSHYILTHNDSGYINELYSGIVCLSGECDPTTGTAISVSNGSDVTGIDFQLDLGGRISGTLTDTVSGLPIPDVTINFFTTSGRFVTYANSNAAGAFTSADGLPAGNYYTITSDVLLNHVNELFDNIPCVGGYCDPLNGTAISVVLGKTTGGVHIALDPGASISGTVLRAEDSKPLRDVGIWVFDSNGNSVAYGYSDSSGNYSTLGGLASENYFALTDNSEGYVNELYRNMKCVAGLENCDSRSGTPIAVTVGLNTPEIHFRLSSILFQDDFDDGLLATDWNFSGSWWESNGVLGHTGTRKGIAVGGPAFSGCGNCSVQADLQTSKGGIVSLIGWWSGPQNYVELRMEEKGNRWVLLQRSGKGSTVKSGVVLPINPGVSYRANILFDGTDLHVYVANTWILSQKGLGNPFGTVGFMVSATAATFDNLEVRQTE